MTSSSQSVVLDAVVRMVVPMRREFGLSLDVQAFMRDSVYASEVLARAFTSQVQRLRAYAVLAERHMRQPSVLAPATVAAAALGGARHRAFEAQRREAAKQLIDLVGPGAEPLAVRMERAADAQTLAPLLGRAGMMIEKMRGTRAAHAYLAAAEAAAGSQALT